MLRLCASARCAGSRPRVAAACSQALAGRFAVPQARPSGSKDVISRRAINGAELAISSWVGATFQNRCSRCGGTRVACIPSERAGRRTSATIGASASHCRDPNRTRYTVPSAARPLASVVGVCVTSPSEVSRARAWAAAVGETPARRAASRTDATPRGERDSAASTLAATRDRPGSGTATPSFRARSSTCRDVRRKAPEAARLVGMPRRSTARRTRGAEVPRACAAAARL